MFEDAYTKILLESAKTLEQRIIEFFGSEEEARAQLHLYVLEETSPTFSDVAYDDKGVHYSMEQELRLRLKTPEELATEEKDELEGWEPTKWWQAIADDDTLLAETSSPGDFKTLNLYEKPGVTIVRLYREKIERDYMRVKEDPFKE